MRVHDLSHTQIDLSLMHIYLLFQSWNPRHGLFLVGSTLTGFGGISSDVDMCLIVRHPDTDQRRVALAFLPSIHKLISTLGNSMFYFTF